MTRKPEPPLTAARRMMQAAQAIHRARRGEPKPEYRSERQDRAQDGKHDPWVDGP